MIYFERNGRRFRPNEIADAIERAIMEGLESEIRAKIGSIRDPETGEFPTVVLRGNSLESLSVHAEGSPRLLELVNKRLRTGEDGELTDETDNDGPPSVFLSYTSEDSDVAKWIATKLQDNGIDTWWDQWCIAAGDSLRQKIDEGLADCSHFIVLLTPRSIVKPWVNQEIDAGLIRKLNDQCRFLPIRHQLPPTELAPLLAGMHSPEICSDDDILQLINDIHGIGRKPKLGVSPHAQAQQRTVQTEHSVAATAVAQYFVENTRRGRYGDPIIDVEHLADATGLTVDDVKDALYELSDFFGETHFHTVVKASLFAEFDRYWKCWDPREDALRLAADILNDPDFPATSEDIAELYKWEPRRLNPAATYLFERGLIIDYNVIGNPDFEQHRIVGQLDGIRRFVKSRQ